MEGLQREIPREISSRSAPVNPRPRATPAPAEVRGRAGPARSVRGCPPQSRAPAASHARAPAAPPLDRRASATPGRHHHGQAHRLPALTRAAPAQPLHGRDTTSTSRPLTLLVGRSLHLRSCQDQLLRPVGIKARQRGTLVQYLLPKYSLNRHAEKTTRYSMADRRVHSTDPYRTTSFNAMWGKT